MKILIDFIRLNVGFVLLLLHIYLVLCIHLTLSRLVSKVLSDLFRPWWTSQYIKLSTKVFRSHKRNKRHLQELRSTRFVQRLLHQYVKSSHDHFILFLDVTIISNAGMKSESSIMRVKVVSWWKQSPMPAFRQAFVPPLSLNLFGL